MLLLFRFVLILLLSRFRRRVGPLEPATVRFTALPHDCDLNFHLNGGRYVSFMDISRVELLARMRVFSRLLRRGWRLVMGGITVTFRRSVMPFERFSVVSRVVAWDEKWFYIEHTVNRRDGAMAASGLARLIVRGKDGNVPPREVLAEIGYAGLESPEVPA